MCKSSTLTAVLACVVCLGGTLFADYYENFNDGHYWADPNDEPFDPGIGVWPYYNTPPYDANVYDIDNPQWSMFGVMGQNYQADASDGWLRLYAQVWFGDDYFIGAVLDDGDVDANTSTAYFDDSAPHYILSKIKVWDPDKGQLAVILHADAAEWTCYGADLELMWEDGDPNDPNNDPNIHNEFMACHMNSTEWNGRRGDIQFRPELETGTGIWMICQWDGDGDPNHSYIRVSVWNGDKYDGFDPNFNVNRHVLTAWDPNEYAYWGEGLCGIGNVGSWAGDFPLDIDAKFDQIECRWGMFNGVARTLALGMYHGENGAITSIDPDLLADPNNIHPNDYDPVPDLNDLRRYTDGTLVCLTAEPLPGKTFLKWKIMDNGGETVGEDTNQVMYLTMDQDYQVEAQFKCGSSVPPFVAMTLLALAAGVVIRRRLL